METRAVEQSSSNGSFQIKTLLQRQRSELVTMLARKETRGCLLAQRNARIMDDLLCALYSHALAATRLPIESPVVIGAVGSYGRQFLGLRSDVDVKLLTTGPADRVQPLAEALLYPLWDAGIDIGHQVISVHDAVATASTDLPTATAVLDFRALAGDMGVARELEQAAFEGPFCLSRLTPFLARLEAEVANRHRRFAHSGYLLEPDLKNGPGGLRDLDVALWVGRARFRGAGVEGLLACGALDAREASELNAAIEFLWTLRNQLHHHARRRNDRLTFDEQERIADLLGYRERVGGRPGLRQVSLVAPMVEAFMSDYFRHARVIARMREQLFARAYPAASSRAGTAEELGGGLERCGGKLCISNPRQLQSDPALALRLYAKAVELNCLVGDSARDLVTRTTSSPEFTSALRSSSEASSLFVKLVNDTRRGPFPGDSILSELHAVGLLLAMIPEFGSVVGLVHHDVYHVYTVDVHSIGAVDWLRALCRGEFESGYPVASPLACALERPTALFLAALLHDIGKAIGSRGHAQRGAEIARRILQRLGLSHETSEQACTLVAQHLSMYVVATRRDLAETRIVADFARELDGRAMLRDLYLLTLADVCTTSPDSMTTWKAHVIEELFTLTDELLAGIARTTATRIEAVRERVRQLCNGVASPSDLDEFLSTMPERYLLANAPTEIAAHAAAALGMTKGASRVSAKLVPCRHEGVSELCIVAMPPKQVIDGSGARPEIGAGVCVVASDRPGLLAAVTAALVANRLEIHAAQIHSRTCSDGTLQAVDLFFVRDRVDGTEGVERNLSKLQADLDRVMSGAITPDALAAQPAPSRLGARPAPRVGTRVTIDNRSSARHTVIEVLTKDRPGLLFTIANLMYQLNLTISAAKVSTEGHRVIDVFYVTETNGAKLSNRHRIHEVRRRLMADLSDGREVDEQD